MSTLIFDSSDYANTNSIICDVDFLNNSKNNLKLNQSDLSCDVDYTKEAVRLEACKKRKKRYLAPLLFIGLEIGIVWVLLSIFNLTFDPREWFIVGVIIFFAVSFKRLYKMLEIYERSKNCPSPKEADNGTMTSHLSSVISHSFNT